MHHAVHVRVVHCLEDLVKERLQAQQRQMYD
jgi:hypothetical protein